jgi:Uma2 family endonuclease
MGMPAIRRRWTTAEVRALIDESRPWPRYELIDGELLVTPAPGRPHQLIVTELLAIIKAYVDREEIGVTFVSPADLELAPGTITQPDVFVVRAGSAAEADDDGWVGITSLLLAVEVLSPGSGRQDRVTKRDHYMSTDVAEYWIVDADARMVERWLPARETPVVERTRLEWTPSMAMAPLVVDLVSLFERVAALRRMMRG